ncbi:MAG: membrane protein insertion efficiency factor YidD [Ignavibacteria bacterium]
MIMRYLLIFGIKCYQIFLSRFTPDCLYKPSCSEYAILAIQKYGVKKGWRKFKDRYSRCTVSNIHLYGTEDYP